MCTIFTFYFVIISAYWNVILILIWDMTIFIAELLPVL